MTKFHINGPFRCIECFQIDSKLINDHSKCDSCAVCVSGGSCEVSCDASATKIPDTETWWYRLTKLSLS